MCPEARLSDYDLGGDCESKIPALPEKSSSEEVSLEESPLASLNRCSSSVGSEEMGGTGGTGGGNVLADAMSIGRSSSVGSEGNLKAPSSFPPSSLPSTSEGPPPSAHPSSSLPPSLPPSSLPSTSKELYNTESVTHPPYDTESMTHPPYDTESMGYPSTGHSGLSSFPHPISPPRPSEEVASGMSSSPTGGPSTSFSTELGASDSTHHTITAPLRPKVTTKCKVGPGSSRAGSHATGVTMDSVVKFDMEVLKARMEHLHVSSGELCTLPREEHKKDMSKGGRGDGDELCTLNTGSQSKREEQGEERKATFLAKIVPQSNSAAEDELRREIRCVSGSGCIT